MKDLELKDILIKSDKPLIGLSVYFNGKWSYATLTNPNKITVLQSFYLISYPFGLHRKVTTSPGKYVIKGAPGDYVARDNQGFLSLVTAHNYSLLFPGPQNILTSPPSSELLRDPNFLTKTLQESVNKDSDKVLIGSKAFSLPSTQKKTITIIETPTGQAQVYFTGDTGVVYDYDLSGMVEVSLPSKPTSDY